MPPFYEVLVFANKKQYTKASSAFERKKEVCDCFRIRSRSDLGLEIELDHELDLGCIFVIGV